MFITQYTQKSSQTHFLKIVKKNANHIHFFTPNKILHIILKLYSIINQINTSTNFAVHANFRLLYLMRDSNKIFIFNSHTFFKKWTNIYTFLFNLFYYKTTPIVFGSIFFKKEILSFNWISHLFKLSTWRLFSIFFIFKLTVHNRRLKTFYLQLRRKKINFALITDVEYHYKTIFYLKKTRWFTSALIPFNINPWYVMFALPILKNNFYAQFFFIKFLFFVKKTALYNYYQILQKFWTLTSISTQLLKV